MIGAIIQARTGSTRLENKVLMSIQGKTMLEHVIRRVQMAWRPELVLVATSDKERDDRIALLCLQQNVICFRGSEEDVLDRFYQCAQLMRMDPIIRITADCPLIDPEIIDQAVDLFDIASWHYTCTLYHPDGLDIEVFSMEALQNAWENAVQPHEREHVTPYIRGRYVGGVVVVQKDLSHLHWSVDTEEDLEFVREVYEQLGEDFKFKDILALKGVSNGTESRDAGAGERLDRVARTRRRQPSRKRGRR